MPCSLRMKYRLWNLTTQKWVRNEDNRVCQYDLEEDANDALETVNQIKKLNPEHRDDQIVVHVFYEE